MPGPCQGVGCRVLLDVRHTLLLWATRPHSRQDFVGRSQNIVSVLRWSGKLVAGMRECHLCWIATGPNLYHRPLIYSGCTSNMPPSSKR